MKKFLLFLGVAGAALSVGTSVQAADAPAYGDLYNVEWCPCNPEEPFDADGSVVMGKTVMCPCNGLYSGYKKVLTKISATSSAPPKHSLTS